MHTTHYTSFTLSDFPSETRFSHCLRCKPWIVYGRMGMRRWWVQVLHVAFGPWWYQESCSSLALDGEAFFRLINNREEHLRLYRREEIRWWRWQERKRDIGRRERAWEFHFGKLRIHTPPICHTHICLYLFPFSVFFHFFYCSPFSLPTFFPPSFVLYLSDTHSYTHTHTARSIARGTVPLLSVSTVTGQQTGQADALPCLIWKCSHTHTQSHPLTTHNSQTFLLPFSILRI